MTKNATAINREVRRLKALPQVGVFTLLHHRGPLLVPGINDHGVERARLEIP
jgi:hypothetical protein